MAEQSEIAAVAKTKTTNRPTKIPDFSPDDPELWIGQMEIQFKSLGISTQADKFIHVAGNLPTPLAAEVRDLVLHPPADQPYDALRAAILRRVAPSQESRIRKLLEGPELGDKKPSQLLRQMRNLAGASIGTDETLLRQLWLQQLPNSVRPITSMLLGKFSLDEVAEAADEAITTLHPEVHHVQSDDNQPSTSHESNSHSALLLQICQGITQLTAEIRASRNRSRSRSRRRGSRSKSPGQHNYRRSDLCWYHQRFGPKAYKCVPPCHYEKPEN